MYVQNRHQFVEHPPLTESIRKIRSVSSGVVEGSPETPQADVLPDEQISRALVVSAHPDDIEFGSAGTVATWTAAGIHVVYCVCTDGQAGGFDPDVPRTEIPRIRRDEQRAAAEQVGVTDVRFLGRVDGELRPTPDLVRDLTAVIREVRPDRLLLPSSERIWEQLARSHPDHLAAGEAGLRAMYPAAQNQFAFPELLTDHGLEAWKVRELWLAEHPTTNHAVDITDVFDRKLAALLSHQSQHPDPDRLGPMLTEAFGRAAEAAGLPAGRLAETFAVYPAP